MRKLGCFLLFLPFLAGAEEQIAYNRDVRPILSDNCFSCHGFDEEGRKAGLRLDTFEGATTETDGVVAIKPGDVEGSEIWARINSTDPDEVMPPPETAHEISPAEREILKAWIEQGATYEEHWAWEPLKRPETKATGAAVIDDFLAAGWTENKAEPVGKATPRERLRRLSFDLRGLPPTAAEVEAFEQHPTDAAFFAQRDRWMKELAYAENQGLRWLDLVRWADTSGFVSDEPIASGAYRAWVIEAIQKNMPFDQFSIEQLAGDLLPNATDAQLTASGYNRIVNTNCEAGGIEEEQLYKLKGEHVRALGTVWLGLTTGCAECHDHKFDPISAKDYYSMAAYFDDLVEAGVYTPGDRREPLHYVHEDLAMARKHRDLKAELAAAQDTLNQTSLDGLAEWKKEMLVSLKDTKSNVDFDWVPGEFPAARVIEGEFERTTVDGQAARLTHVEDKTFHRHVIAELMTGFFGSSYQDNDKHGFFVEAWIEPDTAPEMLGFQITHGSYGRLGWRTENFETYIWGEDSSGTLKARQPWSDPKRVKHMGEIPKLPEPGKGGWVRLFVPKKDVMGGKHDSMGMAWLHTGGTVRWGNSGLHLRKDVATKYLLGESTVRKWWEVPFNRETFQKRMTYASNALKSSSKAPMIVETVEQLYREHSNVEAMAEVRRLESRLHENRRSAIPVLVSRQAPERKTTRVLHRGDYLDKTGPIVSPAVPEFLGSIEDQSRLGLATWLFSNDNPLTARVFVNRLWHQFYGRGISESLEDSGTQGDWPSHLPLLDWLACEFRDSGWDRNHMVRLLTSAKAYQMSSKPSPDLAERDPSNRWHARQGRYRLTAEAIRDTALTAAGLLAETTTVPKASFFPYQPSPYWTRSDKVMYGSRHMVWETSQKRHQYNRSLYTFWKRQNIHPMMMALDAPTRQECTPKRNITNTPGQALALLNDPIYVEASRVLAERVLEGDAADDSERLHRLFQWALQREPIEAEATVLAELLKNQRAHYKEAPDDATALLAIGQSPAPAKNTTEVAAWTVVARTILNLHEFLTRP